MRNFGRMLCACVCFELFRLAYGQSCYFSYYSLTKDPITDIRTATPLTLRQSYTVSACVPPGTPEVWTWIAIFSSTQYTAVATNTYSGLATEYTVTYSFTGLLLDELRTLDVIGLEQPWFNSAGRYTDPQPWTVPVTALTPDPTVTPVNGVAVQIQPSTTPSQTNSATPASDPNAISGASSTAAVSYQMYTSSPSMSTPSETSVPVSNSDSVPGERGLSHGAVGGITVGTFGLFVLIGLLWRALLYLKTRRDTKNKRRDVVGAPEFEPEYPPEKNEIFFASNSLADIEIAGGRLKYPNEGILYSGRLNTNVDN